MSDESQEFYNDVIYNDNEVAKRRLKIKFCFLSNFYQIMKKMLEAIMIIQITFFLNNAYNDTSMEKKKLFMSKTEIYKLKEESSKS